MSAQKAEDGFGYSLANVPIEDLRFSVRTLDRLKANEITNVGQLLSVRAEDLLGFVGRESFDEIIERLAQRGILTPEMVTEILNDLPS